MSRLPLWAAALWWGSLSTVGFLVVPMLFAHLPTPLLAGTMAAQLFSAQTWLSCVCALILLLSSRPDKARVPAPVLQTAVIFIVAGMLLALLSEFAVAPRIVARENLRWWHGVGSAMYVLQWLCAGVTLWKLTPRA